MTVDRFLEYLREGPFKWHVGGCPLVIKGCPKSSSCSPFAVRCPDRSGACPLVVTGCYHTGKPVAAYEYHWQAGLDLGMTNADIQAIRRASDNTFDATTHPEDHSLRRKLLAACGLS